jgi:hypothetical protein
MALLCLWCCEGRIVSDASDNYRDLAGLLRLLQSCRLQTFSLPQHTYGFVEVLICDRVARAIMKSCLT